YYNAYKWGSLKDVAVVNYRTYPSQWIFTWIEWRDMSENLGRFLLRYYDVRRELLTKLKENISLIKKVWIYTLFITVMYVALVILSDEKIITVERFILYPFLKAGVLFMAIFYACSI